MKRVKILLAFIIVLFCGLTNVAGAQERQPYELLVKLKPGRSLPVLPEGMAPANVRKLHAVQVYLLSFTGKASKQEVEQALAGSGSIEYSEENSRIKIALTPNDFYFAPAGDTSSHQWALPFIKAEQAWDITTGTAVKVAVIDTGVDYSHPDLLGKITADGTNLVNSSALPEDDNGHGTAISGIIGALTGNTIGIAGTSWGAVIMPVKVAGWNGEATVSAVAEGIVYAADHGAELINISMASAIGIENSATLQDAINYALERDIPVFAAGGNHAYDAMEYPAILPGVMAVEASDASSLTAYFSNFGEGLDVMAPGVDIISTYWTAGGPDYARFSGSSAACGYVTGLAALIKSIDPSVSRGELEYIIEHNCLPMAGQTAFWEEKYGYGLINMYESVFFTQNNPGSYSGYREPDDFPALAYTLTLLNNTASTTSYICFGSDTDYYEVTAPASGVLEVLLTGIPDGCDYDVYVYNESGAGYYGFETGSSRRAGTLDEDLSVSVTAGARYYLEVRGYAGFDQVQPYALRVNYRAPSSGGGGGSAGSRIERIYGADRYLTSVEVSKKGYRGTDKVILASGADFPDALAAASLSEKGSYPLLINPPLFLRSEVRDEIRRLDAQEVFLIGGKGAVSETVESSLKTEGLTVTRIGGTDRYETAVMIAEKTGQSSKTVMIATGENFPDALSVAAYSAYVKIPILLTNKNSLPQTTADYLTKQGVMWAYLIGGEGVVPKAQEDWLKSKGINTMRIAGADRYETSVKAAEYFYETPGAVVIATGENFPDALSSSSFACLKRAPVVITAGGALSSPVSTYLKGIDYNVSKYYLIGGEGVISAAVKQSIENL